MGCVSDAKSDPWRLERFVAAQDRGGTYQRAVAELRAGAQGQPLDVVRVPAGRGAGHERDVP